MSRHIKLNNSSVSDYFKAKALDKGWIKEEVIEKKASGDVNISDNLDVNISTLILQLKQAGLKDLAGELTDSFVYYKRAASGLYNVTKDEYNKLTHLAHPKGSTKLENMSGDCVVEDIHDTQKALMSLLKEKKRVKKAQSNTNSDIKTKLNNIKFDLKSKIDTIRNIVNQEGDFSGILRDFSTAKAYIDYLNTNSTNFHRYLLKIKYHFNRILEARDGLIFGGDVILNKPEHSAYSGSIKQFINQANSTLDGIYKEILNEAQLSTSKNLGVAPPAQNQVQQNASGDELNEAIKKQYVSTYNLLNNAFKRYSQFIDNLDTLEFDAASADVKEQSEKWLNYVKSYGQKYKPYKKAMYNIYNKIKEYYSEENMNLKANGTTFESLVIQNELINSSNIKEFITQANLCVQDLNRIFAER